MSESIACPGLVEPCDQPTRVQFELHLWRIASGRAPGNRRAALLRLRAAGSRAGGLAECIDWKESLTRTAVSRGTLGPAHDPYARETLTILRDGHSYAITWCALMGTSFKVDGEVEATIPFWAGNDREVCERFHRAVVEFTGAPVHVWEMAHLRKEWRQ